MRGIIENGVNGFLCEPGDADKLRAVLRRIESLEQGEAERIRRNAMKTASQFTQGEQAERYLSLALSIAGKGSVR